MKTLLLFLLFMASLLYAAAQPQWRWAKGDTANYTNNLNYLRETQAVSGNKLLWATLQNRKINYGQTAMGECRFRELDSAGNTLASFTATGKLAILQMLGDSAGNWYALGTFYDTVSLGSGMGFTRDPLSNTGNLFLLRLHGGTLAPDWLQLICNTSNASAGCFVITRGRLVLPLDSLVATHLYQYNMATGAATKLWTQTGRSSTTAIQADSAGNIYLAGSCLLNGPLNFNGTATTVQAGNQYPWYIARYHADGRYHWHQYLTDVTCTARSLKLQGNNALYLSGLLSDSLTIGSFHLNKPYTFFNADYIIARLDSTGSVIWAQQRPSTGSPQGLVSFGSPFHAAVVDTSLFLVCETQGASTWGTGIATNTNNRHRATLVSYSTATGNAHWAKTINGNYTTAQHLTTDGISIWLTGSGSDSSFLQLDTVSVAATAGRYFPYVAKMQIGAKMTSPPPPPPPPPPPTATGGITATLPIAVWPNPAAGFIVLEHLSGREDGITIRDMTGRVVLQPALTGGTRQRISTNMLARGVYTLEIRSGQSSLLKRLVLE